MVRGSFYAWFTDALAAMLKDLLGHAVETVWEQPPLLTGRLGKVGVKDWIFVDSETFTLPDELADIFPASSKPAGLKVHKYYSLGRNNVVDIEITPAREHDAPVLRLDSRWRGMGLIVDLPYVSLDLIQQCQRLGILLVMRLKKGWKPRMLRTVDEIGELLDIDGEPVLDDLLDVAIGRGKRRSRLRSWSSSTPPCSGRCSPTTSSPSTCATALEIDDPRLWHRACRAIRSRGHDPNWRRPPSVLEQLRGLTAPPGRPRRSRQCDCPPSARPYRQHAEPIL